MKMTQTRLCISREIEAKSLAAMLYTTIQTHIRACDVEAGLAPVMGKHPSPVAGAIRVPDRRGVHRWSVHVLPLGVQAARHVAL